MHVQGSRCQAGFSEGVHPSFKVKLQDHTGLVQRLACSHKFAKNRLYNHVHGPNQQGKQTNAVIPTKHENMHASPGNDASQVPPLPRVMSPDAIICYGQPQPGEHRCKSGMRAMRRQRIRLQICSPRVAGESVTSALSRGNLQPTCKLELLSGMSGWIELVALRRLGHDAVDVVECAAGSHT